MKRMIFIVVFLVGLCFGLYFNFAIEQGRYQISLSYLRGYQAIHQKYADNPELIFWNSSVEQELLLVDQYQYIIDTLEGR